MTGVAPNSIAAQVVNGLLAGGATVVATSHSFRQSVKAWAKQTYREHAAGDAKLWLVPANLSSYRDVDALVAWVGNVQKKTSGATTTILKPAYEPSLFFPFAAPPVHGTLADSGELFESQARLMLWGVERAITGFAKIGADTDVQHKLHVILPGSPNRGVFGGDGAYGEVKSAFDAIVNRARAEKVWSSRVTFAHPKIGWVRGTGLMGGNDPLVEVVERHGLKTYSTAEIAVKLLELSTKESREQAVKAPLDVDLTGGLGSEPIDIKALRAEAMEDAAKAAAAEAGDEDKQGDCAAAATLIKHCRAARPASGEGRSEGLAARHRPSGRRDRHRLHRRAGSVGLRPHPFRSRTRHPLRRQGRPVRRRGARTGLEHGPADLERQPEAAGTTPTATWCPKRTSPNATTTRSWPAPACVRSKRAWATITRTVPTRRRPRCSSTRCDLLRSDP